MNGIVLVDKPKGPTSFEIVRLVRRAAREKKVGHTGTLDPMATGLLVVCLGEATKLVPYLMNTGKRYLGVVTLGVSTDTDDALGEFIDERPVPPLEQAILDSLGKRFLGQIAQVPPLYCALKKNGEALYHKARRGELVELPPRMVDVESLDVRMMSSRELHLDVRCGKGFYVRALARDLAHVLGTVGHLSMLRRLETSGYCVEQACDVQTLEAAAHNDPSLIPIQPLGTALGHLRSLQLNSEAQDHIRHGRPCRIADEPPFCRDEKLALRNPDGSLLAVGRALDEVTITSERWLHL
jgi:tRNA pseudouridine55 synthase